LVASSLFWFKCKKPKKEKKKKEKNITFPSPLFSFSVGNKK